MAKITENCDHNIDPRLGKSSTFFKLWVVKKYYNSSHFLVTKTSNKFGKTWVGLHFVRFGEDISRRVCHKCKHLVALSLINIRSHVRAVKQRLGGDSSIEKKIG
jgi:hypothetical protein